MGQVVSDTVWIGNPAHMVEKGTRREDVPAELVGLIGEHVWEDEGENANVTADGVALSGLRSAVSIDGVMYSAGTVPPDDVLPKVGSHMWVPGFVPPTPAASEDSESEPEWDREQEQAPAEPGEVPVEPVGPEPEEESTDEPSAPAATPEGDEEPVSDAPDADQEDADESETPAPQPVGKVPARSGRGSSLAAWLDFAEANGVEVPVDAERHDVIAACEEARLVPSE
jgi:hypothetical protein